MFGYSINSLSLLVAPFNTSILHPLIIYTKQPMSRKNNSGVSTGVIAGLIGVGAGLLGGYLLKKFTDDSQPSKVRVEQG